MRIALCSYCLIALLPMALLFPRVVAEADEKEPAKFVVVAPKSGENAELGASLYRVLLGTGQRAKFERVESIEEAVTSKADVIVLAMSSRDLPTLERETLESLKKRKIVGIGHLAATLFGQLGLEINDGQCAHGTAFPPSLMVTKSELLEAQKTDEALLVLNEPAEANRKVTAEGERLLDYFAIFLPSSESATSGIDVIARWSSDPNYAPIVRQGNCVLIGIASPATQWTKSYSQLISDTCMALHKRKLEEFSTIRYELTKPGKYEFQLAPRNSRDKPFVKNFYFRFSKPTKLRAEVEHSGSAAFMLLFYGKGSEGTPSERQDAFKGETLTITKEITADDIVELSGRYWVLDVTNFDAKADVNCKLTITIEEP